jgi:hypothetical protein
MNKLKITLIVLAVIIIAIQFIPVNRTNPPVTATLDAPIAVMSVLKNSCYDCHSHETKWPWYSYIAPVSWLVSSDVKEARSHLNFSEWGNLSRKDVAKMKEEIWKEIEKEGMPLWNYTILHPEANLSQEDKSLIKDWAGE